MKTLYLDIETIPADEKFKDELRLGAGLSRSKRRELVQRGQPLTDAEIEALYRETALSGEFGRILCIGYRLDPVDKATQVLTGDEADMLRKFWELASEADLFVGHNVIYFDLRYIYKRSIIHRIKPSREIPTIRYRNEPVYDTMMAWNRWSGELISLDKLARALGLPSSKQELSGEKVYDAYLAGDVDRIYEYCKGDVDLTRQVHRRLTFID
jgi:DNA polymerase elongation subunit (family B)